MILSLWTLSILMLPQAASAPSRMDTEVLRSARSEAKRTVCFKVKDGLSAVSHEGRLVSDGSALAPLLGYLTPFEVWPLFQQSAEELHELRQRGIDRGAWPPAADLSLWFQLKLENPEQAQLLAFELGSYVSVSHAYVKPEPAIPPTDLAPTTPDWTSFADYFEEPIFGTGIYAASGLLGARGRGVRLTDCEYSWVYDHEDLELTSARWVGGTPVGSYPEHGTAVLGQLYARDNGYGVTGAVPNCDIWLATEHATSFGFNPSQAILNAASSSAAGDVILLEMQTYSPTGAFCPEEWTQASFDAIQNATLAGIHVVEAGGNGGMMLNDPVFMNLFDVNVRDSGAVIVGAGNHWAFAPLTRVSSSSAGERVDCQGPGHDIYTLGYGDLFSVAGDPRQDYTQWFGGTSGASPIVTSAIVSLIGAMKAHGMALPTPIEVRDALRVTGSPQPSSDVGWNGRVGPNPLMSDLYTWFDVPSGMQHVGTVSPGTSFTISMKGQPGESWTLYGALDSALTSTSFGIRTLGTMGARALGSGVLSAGGTATHNAMIPAGTALLDTELFTQTLFRSSGGGRLSNGGVILVR